MWLLIGILAVLEMPAAHASNLQDLLRSLPEPVALPSYTPPGFAIVNIDACTDCDAPYFTLLYANEANSCYTLSGSWQEIQNLSLQYIYPAPVPLFGTAYFTFGYLDRQGNFYEPSADLLAEPQPNLSSGWLGTGPYYKLESGLMSYPDQPPRYIGDCAGGISPLEAVAIVESLAWVE